VLSQRKVGDRYQFELEINTPGEEVIRLTDKLVVNLKDDEPLEVACRGYYRPPTPQKIAQ